MRFRGGAPTEDPRGAIEAALAPCRHLETRRAPTIVLPPVSGSSSESSSGGSSRSIHLGNRRGRQLERPSLRTARDIPRGLVRLPPCPFGPLVQLSSPPAGHGFESRAGSATEARHQACWNARMRADGPVAARPRRTRSPERSFRMTTSQPPRFASSKRGTSQTARPPRRLVARRSRPPQEKPA